MKNQFRGRPKKPRCVRYFPEITYFKPAGVPLRFLEETVLSLEEIEAIRLKDLKKLKQEEAAKAMKISRITFLRILHSARNKIADCLIYGKAIKMEGGDYVMPNRDGTGPLGTGPVAGRGRGKSMRPGKGLGGSSDCECPKCGEKAPHTRGIPCTETNCPKCGTPMRGVFCR